ncbi:pentapeptide repeat-containing protein [Streptomyces sp. NPDC002589]|uniref:pentapeptide repeat-containing protein n=1 Tax=Streptomyces sp. NPDC002589 TaxID=3154420 RepID=UPI0033276AD1
MDPSTHRRRLGDASICDAEFSDGDLRGVRFSGDTDFDRATLSSAARFGGADFWPSPPSGAQVQRQ